MSKLRTQDTLVLLKPDAHGRRLVGRIISRLEDKSLEIVAMKMLHIPPTLAQALYEQHQKKPFYPRLVRFITLGPVIAMVCRGPEAISRVRDIVGHAEPEKATAGTIRGDYSTHPSYNLIHSSDSPDSAEREIPLFFSTDEFCQPVFVNFPWQGLPDPLENPNDHQNQQP